MKEIIKKIPAEIPTIIVIIVLVTVSFIRGYSDAKEKANKEIEIISTQRNKLSDCVRYSLDKECITLEEVQNFLDTDTDSINNWIFCY